MYTSGGYFFTVAVGAEQLELNTFFQGAAGLLEKKSGDYKRMLTGAHAASQDSTVRTMAGLLLRRDAKVSAVEGEEGVYQYQAMVTQDAETGIDDVAELTSLTRSIDGTTTGLLGVFLTSGKPLLKSSEATLIQGGAERRIDVDTFSGFSVPNALA